MGARSSRMPWHWWGRAPEEPGASAGNEEAEEAVVAEREEGNESEEARPAARKRSRKRKTGPGGPLTKEPRRKRAKDHSGSIYEALFLRGEGSDVRICALGEEWNLHRVHLCQSGYFASMFSGAWWETNMGTIEMQMPDENIDREALHEALGSLYRGSILIPPGRVVAILATASMLQLDKVIQRCGEVMKETVSAQTVCSYYYSAESYGLQNIRIMCLQWLLDNMMTQCSEGLLREVSLDLMREVVASSQLLVMGLEMDVYTMLKMWMFLQLQPTWRGPRRALLPDTNSWFARSRRNSEGTPFLETEQGRAFVPVFQQLRLAYIICDLTSALVIHKDALIPPAWLGPVYQEHWLGPLQTEQTRELWPVDVYVSDPQGNSMRCGGQLHRDKQCSWRWEGFKLSWDLVVCYANQCIIFRCSAQNKYSSLGVSLLGEGKVAFRLCPFSLDRDGRAIFRKDTEYQMLSLRQNQELVVMNLENQDVVFPIYVACNFLYLHRGGRFPGCLPLQRSLEN
ncbi:germ cell-less protein-like 1 [Mesoplodon densirostris]|uniref:germ cell-less protein-like 1 n=1 Tax=Mesoplodon densirostris TaxID=48708 RepID=UPI0028DB3F1E|nr:germ cell-less protein-like 1 [Mesoplodon densirostris]